MINKYTLSFKDQSLELKYQEFQMQQKRKPLLQKLIFILLIVIIAKSIILIINFEMLALYYTIGYLILFSILTFILKFKPQLIRWVLISLNYIILAIYAQTVDGLNQYQYQLQSALIVSSQFIVINTGEFIDALVQVICIFSFYLAFYMLNEPNYSLSIVVSTFFFQVMLIITFYENVSAERSKFKLTIIDDKWDQILENMMVEPCIIFNFNFIKTSFVLKKSIDFIYSIDTTEQLKLFLRNSKVKQNQSQNINLEDFIFQKVQQLNKDNIQQWNKQLTIEYNKKVHEIYYSILSETSPIIVLKIKQYKFANNEKDQILENKYQYKYKILLKSILLQLKIIGQYKNLHLTQIFKILIYHDLLERIEKEFLVSIKIEKIVKLLKYIYPQKQIIIENCYQRQPIWVLKDSLQLILMEIFETILSKQIHIKITNFGFSRLLFVYGIFNQNSKDKLQQRLQQYKRSMEIIEISDLGNLFYKFEVFLQSQNLSNKALIANQSEALQFFIYLLTIYKYYKKIWNQQQQQQVICFVFFQIQMADYDESQQLQLEDDYCKIFNVVGKQQPNLMYSNQVETLNMRNVNYLQISLKSLILNSKQFQDKSIKLNVKLPMIRNNIIDYQLHQTYDIGKNGKQFMFNAQFRSNFQLSENSLGQINQAVIQFQVFSLDVEIGKAEFALSTMIIDKLRCFTYQVPIQQLAQVQTKNNKKGKVEKLIETGQLEFEVQIQDIDVRNQQVEKSPKKEIDIEEQVQKIYEKVAEQNQKEKERKRQLKQQQEEEMNQQLISSLQTFQLYLNIGKMIHINQQFCQEKIEDEQINLYLKFKSYGTQEINQTPTNWNVSKWFINYTVRCPITITSLNKMENIPWILELWAKHTETNQDILVGIARLQLGAIYALILNQNPLVVISTLRNNLSPQIIFDEDIPFEDLRTKQTMAIFKITLAFGTNPQINKLVNSEITYVDESIDEEPEEAPIDNVNEPEKPPEPPQIDQPIVYEKIPLEECLITTLNKISQTIRILPKEQYILIEEFNDIVMQLCGLNFNKRMITSLSQYIQFDQSTLDWHIFLQSWQAFTNYKKQLKLNYTKIYANFYQQTLKIFPSINALERELPHGAFGLVHKQQLKEFLLGCKGGNIPSGPSFSAITINSVFQTLDINSDDQIQISDLVDYLRQFEVQGEISKIFAPIQQLAQIIEKNIQIWIRNNKQQMDDYINNREFQQELRAQNIMEIFQDLGLNCTLLDAVTIMNQIGDYNNVENQDGQKICTEIAFWKYIDWLYQNEIEIKEPSSPIAVPQPKVNGIKKPQPIDFQFLETQLIIDFIQLTYLEGEKYQLQIQLENTGLSVTTPKISILKSNFYENGQIPLNMRAICTLCDKFSHDFRKTLHDRMEFSGLSILLFKDNHILRGSLACEEILTIENEKETFFVQLFDEGKGVDATLIEFKMSIKQQVKDEKPQEGFQLFNAEGQIQQDIQISQDEILNILKPEIMHTFRINIKQINWYKNLKYTSLKVKVSLATDKKILKEAIPCFISDDFNDDFDIVVEYQVKCDQILATQLSKCHLQIQLLLNSNSQNKQLVGYLPIKPLFEESKVAGEIPLDDSFTGAFICTLNLDTIYTTDQIIEQVVQIEEKLKFQKKIIIRIMELILLDYKNELGEIYFMLVDPLNMSESYEVRPNTPSILNTQDCIFILSESELQSDVVELQVRSVMLGEDKIIGNVSIQLKQLNNEGIFGESNYLRIDTKASSLEIAARVGVKVIYVCAKETSNDNYLNAFRYPAIKELESQQNIEQYLRNKLQFSFSEINFLTSLIKNDIFSTTILKPLELKVEQSIIVDLLKEFTFYDSNQLRYVNPNILPTIFGYFNLPDCRDQFIQQIHKRLPNDYQCPSNQFDYLTFLAHLQKCLPNVTPLFKMDMQGPIQHEVLQVIKKSPKKIQEETIPKLNYKQLHFHFECGRNLNALTKRIPNSILKFPQLDQESKVFHCSANPQYDALISVDAIKYQNLVIQILDKKYSVDDKEFYKYNLIGQATIYFDQINQQFPQVIQLQLENQEHSFNQTNTIPYLSIKIWTDNEEIIPQIIKKSPTKPVVQTSKETVRRLVFDMENNENDSGKDNATIKNLEKELEDHLKSLKQKRQEQPKSSTQQNDDEKAKEQPKSQQDGGDETSNQERKKQPKKIEKLKPQAYSSSGSSSQQNPPKSSSSGNRLEKIDEKLPINGAELKRIEKILRLNNLPVDKYDSLQDDSDYE